MMARYRKKPVVIEARQLLDNCFTSVATWCDGAVCLDEDNPRKVAGVIISTLEGDLHARMGDYVIKGVKGEFYPCKPDIFEETYESH